MLSKKPIARVQQFLTSKTDDYENWKTRRILGIQPEGISDWFFTVHMGWWNDEEEPFADQWKCIQERLKNPEYREGNIWLMGDFNSQDDVRGEGYDLVLKSDWITYSVIRRQMSALRTLSVMERTHRLYLIITEL